MGALLPSRRHLFLLVINPVVQSIGRPHIYSVIVDAALAAPAVAKKHFGDRMADFARKPMRSTVTSIEARPAPRLTDGSDGFSTEQHYSVAELAQLWALSEKTIRRMFENEPGVLRW